MNDPIRTAVAEIFNRELFTDDLFAVDREYDDGDELVADLGLDSTRFAIGIVACQDEFGVPLDREEFMRCTTFGDVVRLVRAATGGAPAPAVTKGERR
ncbi:phosphopantetheine-binding protein [Nocardia sp. NPDC050697]|uniref:phosphopantetheine-binding protein n=1 Tax=Nocardia sp. NPDC050697 TaxID=3155158 RepID=UPI0033EAA251